MQQTIAGAFSAIKSRMLFLQKRRKAREAAMIVAKKLEPQESDQSSMDSASLNSAYNDARFDVCRILAEHRVDFCIWAEDALSAYEVPTCLFELFLVVENVRATSELLVARGLIRKPLDSPYEHIPEFDERYGRPEATADSSHVVLLAAKDWNYDLENTMFSWLPPIEKLLDSLLWKYLSECANDLKDRLSVHIGYCYLYVDGVRTLEFCNDLEKENWQLHFDLVAGTANPDLGTKQCQEHYRAVREQIRKGELEPTGPSGVRIMPSCVIKRPGQLPTIPSTP